MTQLAATWPALLRVWSSPKTLSKTQCKRFSMPSAFVSSLERALLKCGGCLGSAGFQWCDACGRNCAHGHVFDQNLYPTHSGPRKAVGSRAAGKTRQVRVITRPWAGFSPTVVATSGGRPQQRRL